MNPLTLVKRIQGLNSKEAELGISEDASWHAKYKDSAYVFAGGIPFDLTEGDLLAVFSQYGEIVDVNLVRDKATGKSKGFAFIAYEDQRSTILAIDNLNGAQVLGRTIRVDHVTKYKKKEEEDEETEQRKRQERGVCRAFQMGECTRGAGCKFSHDEQRAANTGWGQHEDKNSRWGHDKFDGPKKNERNGRALDGQPDQSDRREDKKSRRLGDSKFELKSRDQERGEGRRLTGTGYRDDEFERKAEDHHRREDKRRRSHNDDDNEPRPLKDGYRREEERSRTRRHVDDEFEPRSREDRDRGEEKRSRRYVGDEFEPRSREDHKIREERRSRRQEDGEPKTRDDYDRRLRTHDPESYQREDRDERGDSRLTHSKGSSSRHQR